MHDNTPDTLLLDHWRTRRDADAFAELVARYGPLVYSACLRVLRSSAAAEDAAQDCFVELLQSRARVRSLPAFLHTTATRRAVDRLRSERSRADREARFAAGQPITIEATWDDVSACVDEAIAALPDKLQRPIVLRFLQGRSYAEIASATGLPASTIQYQLKQGIEGIRKHLAGRGIPVSTAALSAMLAAAPSLALPGAAAAKIGAMALAGGGTPAFSTAATSLLAGTLAMKSTLAALALLGSAVLTAILFLKADPLKTARSAAPATPRSEMPEAAPDVIPASDFPDPSLAAPAIATAESATTTFPPMGSIAGQVLTDDGASLAEWTVMARYGDHQAQVLTDERGEFLLEGLPPDDYEVTADHPSTGRSAELDREMIQLRAGEAITGLKAVWHTGPQTLSGFVTREDGTPAADIVVSTYYAFESPKGQEVQKLETKTDEDGRYTLSGFPDVPGLSVNVEIEVEHCFHIDRAGIALDGHEEDFILERAPTISGWVRNAETREPVTSFRLDHRPIPVQDKEKWLESMSFNELATATDGAFSYQMGRSEVIQIAVSAPGYVTGLKTLDGVVPGANLAGVEVLLQPAKPLSGVVVDETGDGIAGAGIYFGLPEFLDPRSKIAIGLSGDLNITTSDDSGAFTLTEYPPTLALVTAQKKGFAPSWTLASTTSPIRIVLARGATVHGLVTLDGAPIGDRHATVSVASEDTTQHLTFLGSDGAFHLENMPTGTLNISISFSNNGLGQSIRRALVLLNDDVKYLDFEFDSQNDSYIEGVVLVDDEPLEIARLLAKTALANGDEMAYTLDAQSDGTYGLGPVPPGTYEIGLLGIPLPGGSIRTPEPETVTLQEGKAARVDLMYTRD